MIAITILSSVVLQGQAVAQESNPIDPALVINDLRRRASAGETEALFQLGHFYETGIGGIRTDFGQALRLYCKAAGQGSAAARYRIGRLYLGGFGVGISMPQAAGWLRAAGEMGHAEARHMLRLIPAKVRPATPSCHGGRGNGGERGTAGVRPNRAAPPAEILRLVREMAPAYGLDPDFVLAVVSVESGFRSNAVSPRNAQGLMQLIPDTAERFGVVNPMDPRENLRGGMQYLRWLLSHFRGDVTLTLAGYNAGEGAVARYNGVPPFDETQSYVGRVASLYHHASHPFDESVAEASPVLARDRTFRRP